MYSCTFINLGFLLILPINTVAERDTAAAAQAVLGPPESIIGYQRAAHQLRLAAKAQPRP